MVEDFLSFFMPLCARSISSMKPYHAVLHIVFVFSTSHIYFYPDTRFISSFIWGSFIYDFYLCVYIYMNVIFVCIFYSVTGHHGRTVWLNGPPCINIFEKKKKKKNGTIPLSLFCLTMASSETKTKPLPTLHSSLAQTLSGGHLKIEMQPKWSHGWLFFIMGISSITGKGVPIIKQNKA